MGDTHDTLRVLVEHGRAEIEQPINSSYGFEETALHWFNGSVDDFFWLSAEDKINLVGTDLQKFYASVAMNLLHWGDLRVIQATMSRLRDLGQFVTASFGYVTILDCLARIVVFSPFVHEEKRGLFDILRRLLDPSVDIHNSISGRYTPLMFCAIASLYYYIQLNLNGILDSRCWSLECAATYCTERLKDWADFLKQSGQDLRQYVKMEKDYGTNEWVKCDTDEFNRSDDEYFTSLIVMVKIFLRLNSKEELDIRLVYASKRRRNCAPGEWVEEQSKESSSEDDQGWTYHYPDVEDDTSDFEYDVMDG